LNSRTHIHGTAIEPSKPQGLAPCGMSAIATRSDRINYRINRCPRDVRNESTVTA